MTGEFTIAVHALVFLNHKQQMLRSEELAENVCTNPARIRKVMAKLKKAGLVTSREGGGGSGYRFEGDPSAVSLLAVLDALEEKAVCAPWRSGNPDMECLIASGMASVLEDVCGDLNELCRQRLAGITVADLDHKIFG